MIRAEVVCDSIAANSGKRITTFKLRYPKFIHGELMTHRVISRNASSSRAIPTAKLIEEVRSDALRASPVFWGKNQKGMQAAEELSRDETPKPGSDPRLLSVRSDLDSAKAIWRNAALLAADSAEDLIELGAHKQIVNRLLEPFSHINVVATATEWGNFFGLRLHKDAQPEMRALAIAMWEARKVSKPEELEPGEWHLPFVSQEDIHQAEMMPTPDVLGYDLYKHFLVKISVARCARVSYESFETGKRSMIEEDLKLYDRLLGA